MQEASSPISYSELVLCVLYVSCVKPKRSGEIMYVPWICTCFIFRTNWTHSYI